MAQVRAEVDGYELIESDDGSWIVRTPGGQEMRVTTGNKVKVYTEFLQDPENVCAVYCS